MACFANSINDILGLKQLAFLKQTTQSRELLHKGRKSAHKSPASQDKAALGTHNGPPTPSRGTPSDLGWPCHWTRATPLLCYASKRKHSLPQRLPGKNATTMPEPIEGNTTAYLFEKCPTVSEQEMPEKNETKLEILSPKSQVKIKAKSRSIVINYGLGPCQRYPSTKCK